MAPGLSGCLRLIGCYLFARGPAQEYYLCLSVVSLGYMRFPECARFTKPRPRAGRPDLRWRAEDGEFVLGDVKTIGFGKTRYWGRSPASTRPVDARAGSVHTEGAESPRTTNDRMRYMGRGGGLGAARGSWPGRAYAAFEPES